MGGNNLFGILRPLTKVISTNAVDTNPEFVPGTLYAFGNIVKITAEQNLYRCLTAETPEIPANKQTTENWQFLGKTNPYKMFDEKYKSQTIKESGDLVVVVSIEPDNGFSRVSDGITLLNVRASTINIVGRRNGDITYEKTYDMSVLAALSPCLQTNCDFAQKYYKKNIFTANLPNSCSETEYTITFTPIDEDTQAACGVCILGKIQYFGKTIYQPEVGLVNYDVKNTDDFGDKAVVARGFSNEASFEFVGKNDIMLIAKETLEELRSTPIVYLLTDEQTLSAIFSLYGMINNMNTTQQGSCDIKISLSVESLA